MQPERRPRDGKVCHLGVMDTAYRGTELCGSCGFLGGCNVNEMKL